jgi:hypothetical protein
MVLGKLSVRLGVDGLHNSGMERKGRLQMK